MLVDANVIMYAAGTEHPYRRPSLALLEACAREDLDAAIDAEVPQEILHRYWAIGRWSAGQAVYDLARRIFPEVVPVTAELLDATRDLLAEHSGLTRMLWRVATRPVEIDRAACPPDSILVGTPSQRSRRGGPTPRSPCQIARTRTSSRLGT